MDRPAGEGTSKVTLPQSSGTHRSRADLLLELLRGTTTTSSLDSQALSSTYAPYATPYFMIPNWSSSQSEGQLPTHTQSFETNQPPGIVRTQLKMAPASDVSNVARIPMPGFDFSKYGEPKSVTRGPLDRVTSASTQPQTCESSTTPSPPNSDKEIVTHQPQGQPSATNNTTGEELIESSMSDLASPHNANFDPESAQRSSFPEVSVQQAVRNSWNRQNTQQQAQSVDQHSKVNPLHTRSPNVRRLGRLTPTITSPMSPEDKEDALRRAQGAAMRQIQFRNRNKGRDNTTSLQDLQIARKPVDPARKVVERDEHMQDFGGHTGGVIKDSKDTDNDFMDALTFRYTEISEPVHEMFSANDKPLLSGNTFHVSQETPDSILAPMRKVSAPFISNPELRSLRKSRWATKEETKAAPVEENSNAWGSEIPGDARTASDDSMRPMRQDTGNRITKNAPDCHPELVGWDGKMQPPPADWNDRPQFRKHATGFRSSLNNWADTTLQLTLSIEDDDSQFRPIPAYQVLDVSLHPDGLNMVSRYFTLHSSNAAHYGYETDIDDITRNCVPCNREDFADWGKLDESLAENLQFKEETVEQLVYNWNINMGHRVIPPEPQAIEKPIRHKRSEYKSAPNLTS